MDKKPTQSDLQRNLSGVNTFCMFNLKQHEVWCEKFETTKQKVCMASISVVWSLQLPNQ